MVRWIALIDVPFRAGKRGHAGRTLDDEIGSILPAEQGTRFAVQSADAELDGLITTDEVDRGFQ